jgi:hypothetical protein
MRLHLGSDVQTKLAKARNAPGDYAYFRVYDVALDAEQLAALFDADRLAGVASSDAEWRWLDRYLRNSQTTTQWPARVRHTIFDEGHHWAMSRAETDRRLERIRRAGFSRYVPTVWYGRGTYFPSASVGPDPAVVAVLASDDPLAYLVERAHRLGIEVHASFTVARRWDDSLGRFFGPGVPANAYDVHDSAFRDFIVDLVAEAAQKYALDGVNLDYIRAMGICTSAACRRSYNEATGRNLAADSVVRFVNESAGRAISEWQGRGVADIVSRIRTRLDGLGRHVHLSVCFDSVDDAPYSLEGRDAAAWLRNGWIDLALDMQYAKRPDLARIEAFRRSIPSHDRHIVLFANWDRNEHGIRRREPLRMEQLARFARPTWPESGFGLYLYEQLDDSQIDALGRHLVPGHGLTNP